MKLEINELSKTYGQQKAVSNLSLQLPPCRILALLGPSGGGKSTLLRLMAGLEKPDSGWIAFDDVKITYDENSLRKYRQSLGIVFQSWNLFPHLTALENIILPLYRVHKLTMEESEARSLSLLKRFDLDKHAHKKPSMLSGGQVQRIALIRALAGQPKMLMLDEPTSALDPMMTCEILDLILELKEEQHDLILVTHHLMFAKKIADWVLFIDGGKALESGPAAQVFEAPSSALAREYMSKILAY